MPEKSGIDLLELRITIAASPSTVFEFVSQPAAFERWMGAGSVLGKGVGAGFKVVYPNGHVAAGVVEEIVPNKRVVMSWGYENGINGIPPGATRVEISLTAQDGGTLVTLRHSGLRDAEQRRNHRAGWRHYLASLSQLASASLDSVVGRTLDSYIKAWAERDPATRRQLLTQCWATDGVFRDAMGYAEGLDDLSENIGMAQMFAPGIAMSVVGVPSRSQGFLSHRWQMTAPDGTPVMTGSNTLELDSSGLIRSCTGFWDK